MIRLLEARAISKFFGGLTALSEVSLTINKGEVYGLIGPNAGGQDHSIPTIKPIFFVMRPSPLF